MEYTQVVVIMCICVDEAVVSSTPKPRSSVVKKLTSATPKGPSRLAKDIARSTPHRMYTYRVPSTPASKNNRPLHSTTLSGNKYVQFCVVYTYVY